MDGLPNTFYTVCQETETERDRERERETEREREREREREGGGERVKLWFYSGEK